jgi:PAS domain S-box-containing protein
MPPTLVTPLRSPAARAALAVGLALLGTLVTWLLRAELAPVTPYYFFYIAVLLTAFLAGTWPGLLTTALGAAAAAGWLLQEPAYRFSLGDRVDAIRLALYLFISILASVLCGALHRAWRQSHERLKAAQDSQSRLERSEWAARVSEQRFRTLFQTSALGMAISRNGITLAVNPAYCRMFGYEREEQLVGKSLAEQLAPQCRDELLERNRLREAGQSVPDEYETLGQRKDGTLFPFRVGVSSIELPDGRATVGFFTDITEQRCAEAAAREAATRLQVALTAGKTGTWRVDLGTGHVTRDPSLNRLLGLDESATTTKAGDLLTHVHPDDRLAVQQAAEASMQHGLPYEMEFRIVRADGQVRWVSDRGQVIRDQQGQPLYITGAMADVTDLKTAEMELERLMAQEQAAREQAEAANRSKDQFLAVLSHELRTPLSPVLLTLTSLEMEPGLSDSVRDDLAMIRRNVELETKLIDDLLDVTRIVNGKLRLHPVQTHLHPLIDHVLRMLEGDALEKNLRIERALDAADDMVHSDAARLQQVFWNILKNAIKFSLDGGRIIIRSVSAGPRTIRIDITDEGTGIAPEAMSRLFDAFEQGDASVTRQFGGLGLGLAISKAIVDLHGGSIRAMSEGKDRGATFSVELPTVAVVEKMVSRISPDHPQDAQQQTRVLLVEDHHDTARMLQRYLRGVGIETITAASVAAALALADENPFDLVVSDIGLPDASGLDLMQQLRDRYQLPGIAISGFGTDADHRASLAAGFITHLTKPVDPRHLLATIRQTLINHPAAAGSTSAASTEDAQ